MTASDHLSSQQFHVMDEAGERHVPGTVHRIEIRNIKKGMLVRPSWGSFPFEQATGDAVHDPEHPGNDPDDPAGRMFIIPYKRKFSPHQPEEMTYHLLRPT